MVTSAIIAPRTLGQLQEQLSAPAVVLEDDVLDAIVRPGVTLNSADAGYAPPSVVGPGKRRRPASAPCLTAVRAGSFLSFGPHPAVTSSAIDTPTVSGTGHRSSALVRARLGGPIERSVTADVLIDELGSLATIRVTRPC